jgi:hypothetical protein
MVHITQIECIKCNIPFVLNTWTRHNKTHPIENNPRWRDTTGNHGHARKRTVCSCLLPWLLYHHKRRACRCSWELTSSMLVSAHWHIVASRSFLYMSTELCLAKSIKIRIMTVANMFICSMYMQLHKTDSPFGCVPSIPSNTSTISLMDDRQIIRKLTSRGHQTIAWLQ